MCCLTLERTLAVFWPLASKRLLGTRFTIILIVIFPGTLALAFLPIDYLVYNLRFVPTYAQVPRSFQKDQDCLCVNCRSIKYKRFVYNFVTFEFLLFF